MLILAALLSIVIIICGFFLIYTVYFRFLKLLIIVPHGTSGRRSVTFHKFSFVCDTEKVDIPDIMLNGKVPVRMKYRIESMLRHEFEASGLPWN